MLPTKSSINQITNTVENITNRLEKAEKRIAGIEDKIEEIYSDSNKGKKEKRSMTTAFKNAGTQSKYRT
jgi:uncharacterized protein (UPF0335 family)